MSEPHDFIPKPELPKEELDLIGAVDFRMNNVLTHMLIRLEELTNHPAQPDELSTLQQFKVFLYDRSEAISDAMPKLLQSGNADLQQLGRSLKPVSEQLMVFAGAVNTFLREPTTDNAVWMYETINDAYRRMQPQIQEVGMNLAYRRYKDYILKHNLEDTRTTFVINNPNKTS